MSLIYDYLKIHGKGDSESDSDVEIPPSLKRKDTNRLKSQSLLLIIGSCLIGVLLIFLALKMFSPSQQVEITADVRPVVPVQEQEVQPETIPAPQEFEAIQEVEMKAPEPVITQAIQVFPEKPKPATVDAETGISIAESSSEPSGAIRKKYVQPLELENKSRKITFPENAPVYTEPQEVSEDIAAVSPGLNERSSAAAPEFYSTPQFDSAAREKSKKFYQAGLQAQYKGDGRIAEIYYKKALEVLSDHMDAMINLSALYVQQERYHEAEDVLAKILAIEPTNSKALVNLGVISIYKDNEATAATQFEAALAANPLEENALVNLAYLAEKNRDYAATENYYRQLLEISQENLEVLLAYGHLLEEQRRYTEAMALYGDTLELDTVKKDKGLYNKISNRMRLLAGVIKKSQP
jgi:tetratricopeptide (TPR) repeat protein